MKIAITGGHLSPALAVIEELKSRLGEKVEIIYLGRKYTFEGSQVLATEYEEVPKTGSKYLVLTTGRLQRRFTRFTLLSLLKIPIGFIQAFYYLLKYQPQVILSFGGYLSVPVVVSGWLLRIPIVVHEQTVITGLANRIGSFLAKRICLTWNESQKHFPQSKIVITGNPIREEFFKRFNRRERGRRKGEVESFLERIPKGKKLICFTGGNQGSKTINQALIESLGKLLKDYYVIHQTGSLEFSRIKKIRECLNQEFKNRYFVSPFIKDQEYGWVLDRTDLIVCRSGANTIYELLALKKPAILIPLPWAGHDEQQKNAEIVVRKKLGTILPQEKLTGEKLLSLIQEMIKKIEVGEFKTEEDLVDLDGAKKVVDEVVRILASAKGGSASG